MPEAFTIETPSGNVVEISAGTLEEQNAEWSKILKGPFGKPEKTFTSHRLQPLTPQEILASVKEGKLQTLRGTTEELTESQVREKANMVGEGIGGTAGALAGISGGGIPGGVAGGAIGTPLGHKLISDPYKMLYGIKPEPYGLLEAAPDALVGGAAEVVPPAVGGAIKGALRGPIRGLAGASATPTRSMQIIDDWARIGVDVPPPATVLEAKRLQGIIGFQEKSMYGSGVWAKRGREVEQQIMDGMRRSTGRRVSTRAAGGGIQRGQGRVTREFKAKAKQLYSDADAMLPEGFSVMPEITNGWMKDSGITFSQVVGTAGGARMNRIAKIIDEAVEVGEPIPYEALKRARSYLGKILRRSDIPQGVDQGELYQVWSKLGDDIEETIKALPEGDDALQAMRAANKHYREGMSELNNYWKAIEKKIDPEEVFGLMNGVARGDMQNASKMNAILGKLTPAEKEPFQRIMAQRLMSTRGGQELLPIETFFSRYEKITPEMRKAIWGNGKLRQYLDDLYKVSKSASEHGITRTDKSPIFSAFEIAGPVTALGGGVAALGSAPLAGFAGIASAAMYPLGVNGSARLLTNPRFVNWLAQGSKLAPAKYTNHLMRLGGIIKLERDPEAKEDMIGFLTQFNTIGEVGSMLNSGRQ